MKHKDGDMYDGEWKNNFANGYGKIIIYKGFIKWIKALFMKDIGKMIYNKEKEKRHG